MIKPVKIYTRFKSCYLDTKTQVTCEHILKNGEVIPTRVDTVVISSQHSDDINNDDMRAQLREKVSI